MLGSKHDYDYDYDYDYNCDYEMVLLRHKQIKFML